MMIASIQWLVDRTADLIGGIIITVLFTLFMGGRSEVMSMFAYLLGIATGIILLSHWLLNL